MAHLISLSLAGTGFGVVGTPTLQRGYARKKHFSGFPSGPVRQPLILIPSRISMHFPSGMYTSGVRAKKLGSTFSHPIIVSKTKTISRLSGNNRMERLAGLDEPSPYTAQNANEY
jgi:hypothetical protein